MKQLNRRGFLQAVGIAGGIGVGGLACNSQNPDTSANAPNSEILDDTSGEEKISEAWEFPMDQLKNKWKSTRAVETAANSAEEFALIKAIGKDLLAEAPRLAYAKWLENRGDERSEFLQDFTKSLKSISADTRFPRGKRLPIAWRNMMGVNLFHAIVKLDLTKYASNIAAVTRPVLRIHAIKEVGEPELPVGASKFGGLPDLPEKVEWPHWDVPEDSKELATMDRPPLHFLAQFNLADFAMSQVCTQLPRTGMLYLFAHQLGFNEPTEKDVSGEMQVIYSESVDSLAPRETPDALKDDGLLAYQQRLKFLESWDIPRLDQADSVYDPNNAKRKPESDMVYPEVEKQWNELVTAASKSDELYESYRELRWLLIAGYESHLLGYSKHFRTSNVVESPEWSTLAVLTSENNWSWCDGEHLAIHVHRDDLADRSFRRVTGYSS